MAVGTQFLPIYTDLRAEVRRSTSVSVGVDDLPYLKRVVNHVYRALTVDYEWAHLRVVPDRIVMAAGQRLYDFPTELDFDGITTAVCWTGGTNVPIEQGIGFDEYGAIDSEGDNRQDPVQRYDLRFSGSNVQFEVWPMPATANTSVQFKGNQKLARLVNDTDKIWIDDELVLLFSAAEVLKADDAKDADAKLQLAQDYLRRLKVRAKATGQRYAIGLGSGAGARDVTSGVQINITPSS